MTPVTYVLEQTQRTEGLFTKCKFPDSHGVFIRAEPVPTILGSNSPSSYGGGRTVWPRSLDPSWDHSLDTKISTQGFGRIC